MTLGYWSHIPFQKCGEQEWAKALPDTEKSKNIILEYGICLDPLKMVKSKVAQFQETLPIRHGNGTGSQRVMIDIYKCIPGGGLPTTGIPATCDSQWFGAGINMYIYEKTVNVKHYDKPVDSAHVKVDRLIPANALRFEAAV